jgi:hypothetical protein
VRGLVVALAALAVAVPASAGRQPAALRLVSESPLTLTGSGFGATESVRVRVVAPSLRTKVVRSTASGRFVVRFTRPGCVAGMLVVTAQGLRTERAASYRRLGFACPPQ